MTSGMPARIRRRAAVRRKSCTSFVGFFTVTGIAVLVAAIGFLALSSTGSTWKNPALIQAVDQARLKSPAGFPFGRAKTHGTTWPVFLLDRLHANPLGLEEGA